MFSPSYALVRLCIFITLGLFSLIVLGLAGSIGYGLGIATAVMTLICVVTVLVLDHFRRGTFVVWTVVELAWLGILGIHWLSTGAYGASLTSLFCTATSEYDYYTDEYDYWGYAVGVCHELQAVTAFGFLNFLLMLGLFIWIVIRAMREHNSGNPNVWRSSLSDYEKTTGPPVSNVNPTYASMTGPPTTAPYDPAYGASPYGNTAFNAVPYNNNDHTTVPHHTDPYKSGAEMA